MGNKGEIYTNVEDKTLIFEVFNNLTIQNVLQLLYMPIPCFVSIFNSFASSQKSFMAE